MGIKKENLSDAGGGDDGHNNGDNSVENVENVESYVRCLVPGALFARFRYKYTTPEICLCEMKRTKDNSHKCCCSCSCCWGKFSSLRARWVAGNWVASSVTCSPVRDSGGNKICQLFANVMTLNKSQTLWNVTRSWECALQRFCELYHYII